MKVYRLEYHDDDGGSGIVHEWFGSRKEMESREKHLRAAPPSGFVVYDMVRVSVPTTKRLLISWLNRNAANA